MVRNLHFLARSVHETLIRSVSHFTLDGVGLEYTWWGTAARGARQVLLVHGALRSAWTWEWLGPSLAAALKTRVVAISRYGHGRSDTPPAGAPDARFVQEATELLPAFRKALSLDDVLLVGESEGAAIALIHAASSSAGVAGVVALAPWVRFERSIVQWVCAAHPSARARHRADDETIALSRNTWQAPEMEQWSVEAFLGSVRCPVVAVQSPGDSAISAIQSQRIARGVSRADSVWLSGVTTLDSENTNLVCDLTAELFGTPVV